MLASKQVSRKASCQAAWNRSMVGWMVILFTNTKGGVGKSTLAAHLTLYLYDQGIRVALLDCDEQASSSEWVVEAEPSITVARAGDPDSAADSMARLRNSHAVVVCDSPGDNNQTARTLMLLADLALFPVGPSILDLRSLAKATSLLKYARQINGGKPEGRLVLNKVKRRDRISQSLPEAAAQLGISLIESQVRDLQAFRDAAQQGTSVTRMQGVKGAARCDIESLFDEIVDSASAAIGLAANKAVANE